MPRRRLAGAGPAAEEAGPRTGAMIGTVLCYVLLPAARLLRALRGNAAPGGRQRRGPAPPLRPFPCRRAAGGGGGAPAASPCGRFPGAGEGQSGLRPPRGVGAFPWGAGRVSGGCGRPPRGPSRPRCLGGAQPPPGWACPRRGWRREHRGVADPRALLRGAAVAGVPQQKKRCVDKGNCSSTAGTGVCVQFLARGQCVISDVSTGGKSPCLFLLYTTDINTSKSVM